MTEIKPCSCSNSDQDKRYGTGNRVFNSANPKKNAGKPKLALHLMWERR